MGGFIDQVFVASVVDAHLKQNKGEEGGVELLGFSDTYSWPTLLMRTRLLRQRRRRRLRASPRPFPALEARLLVRIVTASHLDDNAMCDNQTLVNKNTCQNGRQQHQGRRQE